MKAPPRLLHADLPDAPGRVQLDAVGTHHARVLRVEAGDTLVLFDGRGREASGVVVAFSDDGCTVDLAAAKPAIRATLARMVLVQAWAKADKIDSIVRMATELGVSEVRLVDSRHVVVRADEERRARRVERLARVAREAARQSGRADVPSVVDGSTLIDALAAAPSGAQRWIAHERAAVRLVDETRAIRDRASEGGETWVAVGPEGGWAPDEVSGAEALGWVPVRVAPGVLRVETAAPAVLALALDAAWGR